MIPALKRYVIEREIPGVGKLSREQLKQTSITSLEAAAKLYGRLQWERSYVTSDKTFCDQYHAADTAYWKDVYFWTTPVAQCGDDRGAVCVSSQVGCTLTCSFCHTGTQPLVRNLAPEEIVGQFMVARDSYGEWPTPTADAQRMLSNIVMMGMGEPLYNFDNVVTALKIVMDDQGIALSRRRITLSTSGVVPMIPKIGEALDVNLAVSLHAVNDEVRDTLVPINKKWPIAELLKTCAAYPGAKNSRRITFEYAMLKGVNDTDADARELVRILKPIHAKVNLIPFNPWPGAPYECSSNNRIHRFAEIVNDGGLSAPVRTPRGRDIAAACGQLKSQSVRARGEKVRL